MKPLLKAQDCLDHDPIESWQPKDSAEVDYWLCLHIGPADENGAEMFYVNVLSELAAGRLSEDELTRRKKIIIKEYSWAAVKDAVGKILCSVDGPNWTVIATKLSDSFDWEFHNFRPYQETPN
jgi:hypothetical protein